MSRERPARMRLDRDIVFGIAMLAIAALGLYDVQYGRWRPGPGIGNHLVPSMAYWLIGISGALVVAERLLALRRGAPCSVPALGAPGWTLLVTLAWAIAYFQAVRHVGIAVSTFAFIALAVALLTPADERNLLRIVAIALLSAATFWSLFNLLAPIVTPRQLLF